MRLLHLPMMRALQLQSACESTSQQRRPRQQQQQRPRMQAPAQTNRTGAS